MQDDGYADLPAAHGGEQLIKLIRQSYVGKLVHHAVDVDGQPATVLLIGKKKQLLKKLRLHHADDEVQGGVVIRDQSEQRRFLFAKGRQVKLIMSDHRGDLG